MDSTKADVLYRLCHSMNKEELKKNKIRLCNKCKGIGLSGVKFVDNAYCWNGDYCEECNGIGFILEETEENIVINKTKYLCRKCSGIGCIECNQTGLVDWVTHIMGG